MGADGGFMIARIKDIDKARIYLEEPFSWPCSNGIIDSICGAKGPFFLSIYGDNWSGLTLDDFQLNLDFFDDSLIAKPASDVALYLRSEYKDNWPWEFRNENVFGYLHYHKYLLSDLMKSVTLGEVIDHWQNAIDWSSLEFWETWT